jgi:hypothetical protein
MKPHDDNCRCKTCFDALKADNKWLREVIEKCIKSMAGSNCTELRLLEQALLPDKMPDGITSMPSEEDFQLDDEAKAKLADLFDWQERSANTYWVLGKPLGWFKDKITPSGKTEFIDWEEAKKMLGKEKWDLCKKCGTQMAKGHALKTKNVGVPDFVGDSDVCTVTEKGCAGVKDVLKCPECGFSRSLLPPDKGECKTEENIPTVVIKNPPKMWNPREPDCKKASDK